MPTLISEIELDLEPRAAHQREAQERILLEILRSGERSDFGLACAFRRIDGVASFQRLVPLRPAPAMPLPIVRPSACELVQRSESLSVELLRPLSEEGGICLDLGRVTRPDVANGCFVERFDAALARYRTSDVRAVFAPMHWLTRLFQRGPHDGLLWPGLTLVVGASSGSASARTLVELALEPRRPRPALRALLTTLDGSVIGIDAAHLPGGYTLVPDASAFFEFVRPNSGKRAARATLWQVESGVEYELCVTTWSGLVGQRTGQRVRFVERRCAGVEVSRLSTANFGQVTWISC